MAEKYFLFEDVVKVYMWEYPLVFFYVAVLFAVYGRIKRNRIGTHPEFKYFLTALAAKIGGGLGCSLIYYYYYPGGDTTTYFFVATCLSKLAMYDPKGFIIAWLGDNNVVNREYFTLEGFKPYSYIYFDDRQYMVSRVIAPLAFIGLNSFLLTTVMVATISFTGVWRLFRMLYSYFPRLHKELAIAVLFLPSCCMWGSGILKDSITFSAFCWSLAALDQVFFKRNKVIGNVIAMLASWLLIIWVKPYIFMVQLPVCFLWISYSRIARIRNQLLKYMVLPLGMVVVCYAALLLLNVLGGSFDKFSLDTALESIVDSQRDMANNEAYGANKFDVGALEPTWSSILSKWPVAISASLFRPFVLECNNFVMMLAGIENLLVLLLFIRVLWRTRVIFFFTAIIANPILLVCFTFTVLYGFVTGITTANFGALVRFKIPLMPLFVAGMFILLFMMDERKRFRNRGQPFRFERYRGGDPDVPRPRL